MIDEEVKLQDLIEVDVLQRIQDAFCEMTGIAAGVSDADGVAITKDTISTDFCMNFNKKSPIGRARCEKCDKRGGEIALAVGKAVSYKCHTGLVDFAAPIIAHGKMLGAITGGQVRTSELDEEELRRIAKEIDVDPDEYVKASKKIRYIEQSELDRACKFLYKISTIISNMAYDKYDLMVAKEEVERAAQMKADFLANMSHEIRTPMNAVIGMAELASREDLPPTAREYIGQIISSGKTLLTIINDILDFSKIESGKITMENEEYEPMSLINDVANIINTRIGEKDIELILDISPTLPRRLKGDSDRIKQVIINIANNAVKFTKKGQVVLKVYYDKISDDEVRLIVSVVDTGIGIKKQDMDKLFGAFEQLDSKRNRNIEGTGLGLAIAKRIVEQMGGEITVESEYEKGSMFTFWIPQKVFDIKPSIVIKNVENIRAAGLCANGFLRKHLEKDMSNMKIPYLSLESELELEIVKSNNIPYLFIGQGMFTDYVQDFVKNNPDITAILMIDFRNSVKLNISNLLVAKKPVYVMNIASIFNGESIETAFIHKTQEDFNFIAPEANVLIVDDNVINLTVAEGLLKPLQMNIETATGGRKAVDMISKKVYDLVFMDHMMPELDGVEVTHIIRRFHPEYNDVPIIALTANAVSGTKEMFIREGMNDFVAKPIEMRSILSKIKNWLPPEKIRKVSSLETEEEVHDSGISIEGLDVNASMKLLGTESLFWSVLKDYYTAIPSKKAIIKKAFEEEDWRRYTIEVHALKSASRQIGAIELSNMAAELEKAGNDENIAKIKEETDALLEKYMSYESILKPYFKEKESAGDKLMSKEELQDCLNNIRAACEELDMDSVDEIVGKMSEYSYLEKEVLFERLKDAVQSFDVDSCEEVIVQWKSTLE